MSVLPDITSFNTQATQPCLIEITQEHSHLLPQLVRRDAVHDFGVEDEDRLKQFRVGGKDGKKTVFALTDSSQETVLAAIYVFKTHRKLENFESIPGNVGRILTSDANAPLKGEPQSLIFYSISNMVDKEGNPLLKGAGTMLIEALLAMPDLPREAFLSTLSPFRTLAQNIIRHNNEPLSDDQRLSSAYLHLMSITDPVQKFHMGNGAMIGDIKLNAHDDPNAPDAVHGMNVMINYRYTPDQQTRNNNKALFKAILKKEVPVMCLRELFNPQVLARVDAREGTVAEMQARLAPKPAALHVS